jgi:pimeloyl-ACP methyl ester carboxylesterase
MSVPVRGQMARASCGDRQHDAGSESKGDAGLADFPESIGNDAMTESVKAGFSSNATSTVIALHCSLGSGRQWAHLAETLAGRHLVIAPDISGYGDNVGPFELPTTLSEELDLLSPRLKEAVGPIHVVGHSYGGALAFKIATDSPVASRVRSLTLIEPVLPTILRESGPDRPLYEHFVRLAHAIYEDLWNSQPSKAIDKFLLFWRGFAPPEEVSAKSRLRMIEQAEKLAFDFTAALAEQDVTAAAAAIAVPTLLVSGGLSPYLTQRIVWRLASAITDAATIHLPAAGHMLAISHAAEINPEIARHIARADELASLSPAPKRYPAQAEA